MSGDLWKVINPQGTRRVVVTKSLPGQRWLEFLQRADCRVEYYDSPEELSTQAIKDAIGDRCDAAIGQLPETWGEELFGALAAAGGTAYSNYAVGFNNVDLAAATRHRIPVGNTPGVLTEATAVLSLALVLCASRRLGEAERYLRDGHFSGWIPTLLLGRTLERTTLGVVGFGRIGQRLARMMAEGLKCDVVYYDSQAMPQAEEFFHAYAAFQKSQGEAPISIRRAETLDDLLRVSDVVSLHCPLNDATRHLVGAAQLAMMKPDAVLVNTARGPVIDEVALVAHLQDHPDFRVGMDVFEREPELAAGLVQQENAVLLPHIGSATRWAREGMATLAAANVAAMLLKQPAWNRPPVEQFLEGELPQCAPSILNAQELGVALVQD